MINRLRILLLALLTVNAANLLAATAASESSEIATVQERLAKLYPATKFESIKPSVVPGLYEVVMGKNIAYVESSGRYFIFGHIYDMTEQRDLTISTEKTLTQVSFADLPLGDAIKTSRGDGSRVVAVFSDPDCPYCKQLEKELIKLKDVTIYTFLYPLATLHPDAKNKAIAVWCANDRNSAWTKVMSDGQLPAGKNSCANPIDRNIELAKKIGINGTPILINKMGRMYTGAAGAQELEVFISMKD
jgi:thiol:disulfide interchange protein DsbC